MIAGAKILTVFFFEGSFMVRSYFCGVKLLVVHENAVLGVYNKINNVFLLYRL